MKVLHVVCSLSPMRGGITQAVLDMVLALRNIGIDAEIVTTNHNMTEVLNVSLEQWINYQEVPVYFLPYFHVPILLIREFMFSWKLTTWLWKNIKNYDLLHIHALFSYPVTVSMMIARLRQIPYINQPHGLLCEWSLQQSKLKKKIYLSLIEKSNLRSSNTLQVTSTKELEELKYLKLGVSSTLVPLGLHLSDPIPNAKQKVRDMFNIPPEHKIILFMSRFHYKKGLDYLIPALSQLKTQNFTFILAGSGDPEYENTVNELLTKNNLEHCTFRPGFVKGEIKDILLQGSDIFALTSHSENFGIVVLEAMAAGLTTIVTPGVALADMIEENQLGYVTKLDSTEITKVIQYCLNHPEEARKIGERASEFIHINYTWNNIAIKTASVYQ
ncbi:MAG: glycosyltransferase, partial [Dolichospermum sp.]